MSTAVPNIESTYGAWLTSLFLETILYGIGLLQVFFYFRWSPKDSWSIKIFVLVVLFFETTQITFFFRSTYFRFVLRFGIPQGDLIWSDSLQLLANYLSQFTVQIYFASRIFRRTSRARVQLHHTSALGIYAVVFFAFVQISAGIAQTIWTYQLRSYSKLVTTEPITTLQTVASLACDIGITTYLCVFLKRHKNGLPSETETMMNWLMIYAVNRGMLTAASSAATTILFLVFPNTFWFFLSLAPNSKFYMNSMLATLNMREHFQKKYLTHDRGLNTVELGSVGTHVHGRTAFSEVEFVKPMATQHDEGEEVSPKSVLYSSRGSVGVYRPDSHDDAL